MRRLAENVIFQKFRRHEIKEQYEKTTRPVDYGSQNGENNIKLPGEQIEYSRHSTSRDEYSEEHYFTTANAPDQNVKKLHYTQSLQDTFSPPPPLATGTFSKEFPQIQREINNKFEQGNRPTNLPPPIPIFREEQKQEISEEDKGENFLRRQQHKLYQLREETIRKFGHHNGPNGQQQSNSENDEQQRARLHGSLPPLGRQKPQIYSPQQFRQQMHQQTFELVLDRYPPQMVKSISHQSSDPSMGQKRDERAGSCGFSPFPVFGPFAVCPVPNSTKMAPKSAMDTQWDEWKIHHQKEESREENYENTKNIPIKMEQTKTTNKLTTSMISSDEWQSAYEYLPYQKQTSPFPIQCSEQQQSQYFSAQQLFKPTDQKGDQLPEENIEHTFHLYKFGQNPSLFADQNAIKFTATSSARAQFMAPPYPKPWFQQPKMEAQSSSKQSFEQQQINPIEISTFSERQANEEVRAITNQHGGIQPSLNTSLTKSLPGDSGTMPREVVGLPDKVHYHGQPVKVEISGPVHFLHATNMSVTNNCAKTTDSLQTSMTSSVGIPLAPESPQSKFAPIGRQQSPTKWTQTEWENVPKETEGKGIENGEKQLERQQGQTRSEVISPPVERFIESVCDISPILAEIGQNLKEKGEMISPIGNLQTIRRRHEKETKREEHLKWTEKTTEYKYKLEGDQQQPRMRTSQSEATLGTNPTATMANGTAKPRRPSMTSSTVEALSAIWSPYLVESTSHCHLARVTEITQEWRIQQQQNRPQGIEAKCACSVTPNYNREFGKAQFWTMAIPIERKMKLRKTRSLDPQEEMPRLIGHEQYENLRRTLDEVQKDLDNAKEYTRKSRNADVKRIEQAILMISERIQRPQEPVSKAQAEAKEELLRVRLAQMILNLDPDFEPKINSNEIGGEMASKSAADNQRRRSNVSAVSMEMPLDDYYGNALRAPIGLLREKLILLERRLMDEQQLEIAEQLRQINATPPIRRTESQKRKQEALGQRNVEIARMTPLIGMLRHKLGALDAVCQREHRKVSANNGSGRLTPYEERKTVHELLVRINHEIETIHELCRKEDVKDRLDTVLLILKKVANSIDKIMETLDNMSTNMEMLKTPQHQFGPSTLEAAIKNRQNDGGQQKDASRKQRVQQMGRAEMLLGGGGSIRRSHSPIDIEKYSNERRPRDPVQKEHLAPHSHEFYQQQNAQSNQKDGTNKKVTPQVPPKRKSLSTSVDERRGSLYSIVEEKEPLLGQQQKKPSNLTEMSASMGEKTNRKGTLIKQRSRSQTPPPPPRIVRQMQQQSSIGETDGPIPFRLGPCPISYLERDRQMQVQEQRNRLQQNSIWGNGGGGMGQNYLQPPSRKSSQQQKFLQLHQQHQIFSSLEDEEDSVSVSAASSAMDTSSLSVPILFRKKSSICSAPPGANIRPSHDLPTETAILTDEEENGREENCTETFFLRRRRKHAILNAIIYPEQRARVRAEFCGNTFEVDVERMTECGRDSVVMVSEEFYDKKVLIRSGSPVRKSTIMEELSRESSEENTSRNSPGFVDAHTRMAVSINAKSDYDSVHVFLEEIPWGQIGLDVKETPVVSPAATTTSAFEDQRSARSFGMGSSVDSTLTVGRESVLKQISVSEGVGGLGDELSGRLSLRSASRRSSQKSLAHSERSGATTFLIGGQEEELEDIPAYVIKSGSTASITCELNNDCVEEGTKIEWFRGQNEQILAMGGKFERHTQDCVEILVIYDVRPEDGQLYSVKINGELFPVAYLIIEDLDEGMMAEEMSSSTPSGQTVLLAGPSAPPQFLTAPQTQFVMQGETAIISVSMNRANLNVIWSKDGQQLDGQNAEKTKDGRPRIWLESTTTGWYRVIVNEVQFSDQGYYYAQIGDKFTNVQLIVEDRIDEREVQVSSAETDDEELGDYLVPIGSTATIACELENVSFGYRLHWQRNHRDLDARIASGDGKFEHVVNGTKHYLIIHCAQPCDSGVYSVRIGDAKFKVAQITISNEQQLSGSTGGGSANRVKRISSQSLEKIEEKEQQQISSKSRGKRKE